MAVTMGGKLKFGTEVCNVLGIDPGCVRGFDLHVHTRDAATIDITMYPSKEQLDEIEELFKRYEISMREKE